MEGQEIRVRAGPELCALSVQEEALSVGRRWSEIARDAGSILCEGHVGRAEVAKEVEDVSASVSAVAAAVILVAVKEALD